MLAENEIITIQKYFATQPVVKAFLFGSFARNEELPESDIDILVEIDKNEKMGLVKFISMQLDLEELLQKKVDLLEVGGVSKYIMPNIDREKKLFYEKRSRG